MSSQAKIEVRTKPNNTKIEIYFHRMTNLERRKTVRALHPQIERLTGVASTRKAEHSLSVIVDTVDSVETVTNHVVRMFCERFRIASAERARVENTPALT